MGLDSSREHSSNDVRAALTHSLEVADIIDELNTLSKLFRTQHEVLNSTLKELNRSHLVYRNISWEKLAKRVYKLDRKYVGYFVAEVEKMTEEAKRTRTSVINHYLSSGHACSYWQSGIRRCSISSTFNKEKQI